LVLGICDFNSFPFRAGFQILGPKGVIACGEYWQGTKGDWLNCSAMVCPFPHNLKAGECELKSKLEADSELNL
jgi:hypothetical protein